MNLKTSIIAIWASYCNGSNIETLWYKPHHQCNNEDGATPKKAAAFINAHLRSDSTADFVGIGEWEMTHDIPIGNPSSYGSIGSVCGYAVTKYTTPIVLFYRRAKWKLEKSYPPSSGCRDTVPIPNANGSFVGPLFGPTCVDKVVPGSDTCCSCTFSINEYDMGVSMGQNTGQRPWTAGLFSLKERDDVKVCVVPALFPHPLSNETLWDLNGMATSNPRPYSINQYVCTQELGQENCVPNEGGTSFVFGTKSFVDGVLDFCGKEASSHYPIIFMADTNALAGDFFTSALFNVWPLTDLQGVGGLTGLEPYTCCNDTSTMTAPFLGKGYNRYAMDRIAVSKETLTIDKLDGGSTAPGGSLQGDMGYKCHSAEEHAPVKAFITDARMPKASKRRFNLR